MAEPWVSRSPVGGVQVESSPEPLDALLGQETGEELDDELLDPGRGHVSIQGIGSGATVSHGVLGIPAMDCHLDRETPAPPVHSSVTGGRKCPGGGVRVGGPQGSEGAVQAPEVPRRQGCVLLRCCIEGTPRDALARRDNGRHPQEDAGSVANQAGGVPIGTVWHRSSPVGLGSSQEGAGVILDRAQQR